MKKLLFTLPALCLTFGLSSMENPPSQGELLRLPNGTNNRYPFAHRCCEDKLVNRVDRQEREAFWRFEKKKAYLKKQSKNKKNCRKILTLLDRMINTYKENFSTQDVNWAEDRREEVKRLCECIKEYEQMVYKETKPWLKKQFKRQLKIRKTKLEEGTQIIRRMRYRL